ncbi:glucosaminidase domain-containing protein [Bathymodiolus septemdierum thioautotrophic gill symbiont]|uniref:Bax protein n=1 Tax=endosymbiont of Bathymodiolus septemdierum str. Myojin knoll TaxID=1303921 RepID=A0A0P0UQA0_9GAMM|nr:glucosaminidase domain-containing protein [Bathymodiolus septemdierum thioautotrophic gill symbiont]BAS67227.1 Bax protein [endosymbiont of Bathymodiolus septemdierum str. Myojin knoll]
MDNPVKKILLALVVTATITTQASGTWRITSLINSLNTPNFSENKDVKRMKIAFFNYLLPMVEKENQKINTVRSLIKNNRLGQSQLKKIAKKYHLKKIDKTTLLERVDTIPTSLVLAQAAIESNWGRSRFSKYWNNYFGIWCFTKGCGIVPKNRNEGAKHEIMNFASTHKSIEYYMLNLNRSHHYQLLRQIRFHKRKHNLKLTGRSLAEGLDKYSAVGYEYIELIQSVIRQNNLTRFD